MSPYYQLLVALEIPGDKIYIGFVEDFLSAYLLLTMIAVFGGEKIISMFFSSVAITNGILNRQIVCPRFLLDL